MSEWREIETAPKDGTVIIVPGGIAYWRERRNHWEGPGGWYTLTACDWPGRPIQWEVKVWQPLPEPPMTTKQASDTTADAEAFTDEEIRGWIERHGLGGNISVFDARCAIDDARSLHMLRASPPKAEPASAAEGAGTLDCRSHVTTQLLNSSGAVLTNPYTGEPRDYRDVESDPAGTLIVEPGEPLRSASIETDRHPDGRPVFAYLGWPKNRERFHLDIIYPGTTRIDDEYDYRPLYGPPDPAQSADTPSESHHFAHINNMMGNDGANTPSEAVPPIEANKTYTDRFYIPLPGGWEIQTKGGGSSFRICDTKSGQRLPIAPQPYLYETLERMGREIHAAWVAFASRPQPARGEVSEIGVEIHRLASILISDCGLSEWGNESLLERIVERLYKFAGNVKISKRGEVSEAEIDMAVHAEIAFQRNTGVNGLVRDRVRAALEAAARVRSGG
jgi:hypothetical protein